MPRVNDGQPKPIPRLSCPFHSPGHWLKPLIVSKHYLYVMIDMTRLTWAANYPRLRFWMWTNHRKSLEIIVLWTALLESLLLSALSHPLNGRTKARLTSWYIYFCEPSSCLRIRGLWERWMGDATLSKFWTGAYECFFLLHRLFY